MAEEGNKLTLRRLEAPIHKFIKVALPTDLERLQKHHNNILKVKSELPSSYLHDLFLVYRPITDSWFLCFYSTSTASSGTAFIMSRSTPAEQFRYESVKRSLT